MAWKTFALVAVLISYSTFAYPCSVVRMPSPAELIKDAETIVLARAEGLATEPGRNPPFARESRGSAPIQAISIQQRSVDERGIYHAVLMSLFNGNVPAPLVVQTMPLAMPPPSESDWTWFGPGTKELRATVSLAVPVAPMAFVVELFPAATTLATWEEILELFQTAPPGGGPEGRWLPFRTRFKAQTFQGFSRAVVSDDGLNALVYYSYACGSTCGEAGYAWLQRSAINSTWAVIKRLPKVVS